ncbi:MAG: alpha/beta hydrolase, partial [Ignavibacteriaceae bacterium]|nr:alpha/beta hydrolase [Ignavibacteriaceae bacterium]
MKKSFCLGTLLIISIFLSQGCNQQHFNKETVPEVNYFEIQNAKIAYTIYGQGDPIILCMGYGGNMDLWDEHFIDLLKQKFKVIVFDYRGMGYSTNSDSTFTINTLADDINELCQFLNIDKAHILGWSMGGYVAQTFAINYPEKVNKLVLYATDFGGTVAQTSSQEIANILSDSTSTPSQMIGTLIPKDWLKDHPD